MFNDKFVQTVVNTWGEKGKTWLSNLPSIIDNIAEHWNLVQIQPVSNMSYNYVAFAMQNNNAPVVLKCSCDDELIADEYRALVHFDAHGVIPVLDILFDQRAVLLDRAIPGDSLKNQPRVSMSSICNVYVDVAKKIASINKPLRQFNHVRNWCKAIDRITDQRIERYYIEKAILIRDDLLASMKDEYLCHGDLHFDNIIQNNSDWLAIDPKGIVGELAFEAAAFDLISEDELKDGLPVASIMAGRIERLSQALKLPYQRLLHWFYLRAVISAQWFIEDGCDPGYTLNILKYLYELLD